MTKIVTILTEGFADWETSLLNAVAHSFYGVETAFATPGGKPVTSSGGMTVTATLALDALDVAEYDAVLVNGGAIWQTPDAPDLTAVFTTVRAHNKLLGLICDGTVAAARAGLLDTVRHTSNGVGYLDATGYKGAGLYRDTAAAVSDDGIVTAAGTSPVAFMTAVMEGLGLADENLAYYTRLHAAQFDQAA